MYGYGNYGTGLSEITVSQNASIWTIVSFLVAICGGIVLYFTFLNPHNAKNYTGTTKKIYEFLTFQSLSLEAILKICYLVVAIFITITSFSLISTSFVAFLMCLIIGNIVVRILFEGALLILMIYHKISEIHDKMTPATKIEKKKTNEEK